jgi:ActR/RegA family two-component response regulator
MTAANTEKPKILVIDDEHIVHDSVRRILEDKGFDVVGALRVNEALERLRSQTFDLVLTDLMMPDESGMKAVEAVARDHPATGVIMFTGFATVESAVESMKLGALDYLPKPFTPDELIAVTDRALKQTYKARRDREIEQTYAEAERAIRSSLDLREILGLICNSVVRLLKAKGCSLYILRKSEETLELMSSVGLSQGYLEKGNLSLSKSAPEMFETGKVQKIDEPHFDARLQYPQAARDEGIVSILCVPLAVKGSVVGSLRIYFNEDRSLDPEEDELLGKFADQAAVAVENAMAFERVKSDIDDMKQYIRS